MNVASTISPLAYTDDPRAFGEVERCVAALCPQYFFGCGCPAGDNWVHVLDLVGPDPRHLRRILARSTSSDATEVVLTLVRSYAAALVAITTATYLALPYLPDLTPTNVWLCFNAHGEIAALAMREARCIAIADTEDAALRCWLWQLVVNDHIAPLIDALYECTDCSQHQLWHAATTACADVVMRFDAALSEVPHRAA